MADIFVGGTFRPGGPFPFTEDTDNKGGVHVVADATARDAIIASRKKLMMLAVTQDDGKIWQLTQIGPDVWTEFSGGSSGADWSISTPRFFALDYDNGNDANAGFSDVDLPTAGAVAKKTWEGIQAILPINGNGRSFELAIRTRAAGATYRNAADTADADFDLRNYFAYDKMLVRATDTVASASSIAFAGDVNDEICMGGLTSPFANSVGYKFTKVVTSVLGYTNAEPIVVEHDGTVTFANDEVVRIDGVADTDADANDVGTSGINGAWLIQVIDPTHISLNWGSGSSPSKGGTWPVFSDAAFTGTITRYKVTLSTGGPPALPTGAGAFNIIRGSRIRGDIANPTVANRNLTHYVFGYSGDTIIPGTNIAVVDVNDIWYLELPGVAFAGAKVGPSSGGKIQIGGLRAKSAGFIVTGLDQPLSLVFCQNSISGETTVDSSFTNSISVSTSPTWVNLSDIGIDVNGTFYNPLKGIGASNIFELLMRNCNGSFTLSNIPLYSIGPGIVNMVTLDSCGVASATADFSGNTNFEGPLRVTSSFIARSSNGSLGRLISSTQPIQFEGGSSEGLVISAVGSFWAFGCVTCIRPFGQKGINIQGSNNRIVTSIGTYISISNVVDPSPEVCFPFGISLIAWQHQDAKLMDLRDTNGNTVSTFNGTGGSIKYAFSSGGLVLLRNNNAADIERFKIIKATSATQSGLAKADSAANASGALGVVFTASKTASFSGRNTRLVTAVDGWVWVICDTLPAFGDMLYLSTVNAGQAMKEIPAISGTNQKRRLGSVVKVGTSYNGFAVALLRWAPELISINADGLA